MRRFSPAGRMRLSSDSGRASRYRRRWDTAARCPSSCRFSRRRTWPPGSCLPRQTTLDVPSPWRVSAVNVSKKRGDCGFSVKFMPTRTIPILKPPSQAYRQSLVLASALDMRPLVAECHLGLAKLSRLTGNRPGRGAPGHRDNDVPRDGHAVLAGAGGTGAEGAGMTSSVTRRSFLAGSLAGLAAPLAAEAQQAGKVPRVGYLSALGFLTLRSSARSMFPARSARARLCGRAEHRDRVPMGGRKSDATRPCRRAGSA